jgi:phosphohistidine swiveling domain-containing protein
MIINLDSRTLPEVEQVGGKARNLMLLRKRGLAVPPGFCLTCAAYEQHVSKRLAGAFHEALQKLPKAKKTDLSKILARIRRLITEADFDPRLAEGLLESYKKLKAPLMAVRSSANAEDQVSLSFAGQYETILGVSSFEGLQSAVKKCWASLWSERAYEYCRKNDIDYAPLKMAVIVQQQVAADFAGIVFTQDPATGNRDRMTIEYVTGLGDRLVSGHASPNRVTVAKRGGKISDTPAPEVSGHELDPGIINQLSRQAARIEKKFGAAQDIEWAVQDKKIFFLQTRPITTVRASGRIEDRQIWTNANTGEVLPDVVTPLTWSVVSPVVRAIFNSALSIIGVELEDNRFCDLICGRAYFNLNMLAGLVRNIPGFKNVDISTVFGGEQGALGDLGNISIPEEDIPVIRVKLSKIALIFPIKMTKMMTLLFTDNMKYLADLKERIEPYERLDLTSRSDQNLMAVWRELMTLMCGSLKESGYSGMAMLFYPNLDKCCQKWFASKPGIMVNQLLAGIGGIDSAGSGLALCELSRTARRDPRLSAALRRGKKWLAARKHIRRIKSGRDFLAAWDDFMARHGHHARSDVEISYPRWSESPDYVLKMVRNFLSVEAKDDALEHYRQTVDRRFRLTRECQDRLKNPFKRMAFNFYLTRTQRGCVIRENLKDLLVKALRVIRQILLEIGGRLKERKIIAAVDDIFFLNLEEIHDALAGVNSTEVKKLIAKRRTEYKRNLALRPPDVIRGRFDPDAYHSRILDRKAKLLKGLAVSSGVVTGKARVVMNTSSREIVRPGEILVAPFTDPGWTPYFMSAAAIVVDMGGVLSHGSIVAREYGIPAVVNVGPATQIIKTGQLLEVDGDRGTVRIID